MEYEQTNCWTPNSIYGLLHGMYQAGVYINFARNSAEWPPKHGYGLHVRHMPVMIALDTYVHICHRYACLISRICN
eukprot:scaffold406502_cov19-Prasinocladus_malaysianus.AAC.1